jgi:hypothetical protein
MRSENSKRVNDVGKGHGRFARILALAVLATLLLSAPTISFTAVADSEEIVDIDAIRAAGTTYYTPSESMLDSAANVPANLAGNRYERAGLPMTMVPMEGLEDLLQPGYADGAFEDKGTGPSPMGGSDPEPNDAPFLTNDVLVYNDPGSQQNTSIGHWDNGDIMISYDTPGTGGRDVYSSLSTDGGATWNDYPVVADANEEEACASIAGDVSPIFGGEMFYAWYSNPTLEFSWTTDGMTWAPVDMAQPFWSTVSCPYVAVQGDAMVIVAQKYDDQTMFQDTWYILYTLDNFQTTVAGYYWIMWTDGLAYRPRVTITEVAGSIFVMAATEIYDVSTPGSEWHDTLMAYGELTGGGPGIDVWDYWVWGSGFNNQISTNPTIASGSGTTVVVTQEVLDPLVIPVSTGMLFCAWTDALSMAGGDIWNGCNHDSWFLAFDAADTLDQKYPHFHWEGGSVHAVWVNGTDINYKFSPDGGNTWNGDTVTGDPMKVNEAGVGTHLDAWHSPDIDLVAGKPSVAWHDARGGDDIYFQSFGNVVIYTIDTQPSIWDLWVREVGDTWQPPPASYLWLGGTPHDIETIGSYEIPNDTRYTFNQWDDGSGTNPTQVIAGGADNDIVAIYDVEYWLEMINPGGTTNPVSGYQAENAIVTIEAFAPPAPPGGNYIWLGWTGIGAGSYTGAMNPCVSCVTMNGTVTQIANWQLQWEVNFFTQPAGLVVEVNGQPYVTPIVPPLFFNDSEMYSINVPSPQPGGPGLQYVFTSWSDAGPQSHNVFVMAPYTNFTATLTPEYWLTVDTNVAGLTVRVNGMDYPAPYSFWCPQWSRPWLEATSPQYLGVLGERYIWADWDTGGSQTHQHNCTGIAQVTANYVKQYSVNITTIPAGFNVIVDGQTYATPAQFWWNETEVHDIEALASIPVGANNRYNWTDWSDFGAMAHQVIPSPDLMLVASYDFQHKITLQSNSPGTIIELDSSPIALPYVYWCNDGSSHILNAPDPQTFGDTRYMFNSWSDMGAQMHNIVCSAPSIIQVDFDKEYRVYINTTLDGAGSNLDVIAGVATYPTPAEVWWPADTQMTLNTNEFQPGQNPGNGIRFKFGDWDDSGIRTRNINVNTPGLAYVANFGTQYKLEFVDPHGTPTTTPAGDPVTDGIYFDMGTSVEIETDATVDDTIAGHRWRFDAWTSTAGGYGGTDNPATITMSDTIIQTADWTDQYLLTLVSAHGAPDAGGYWGVPQTANEEFWYDVGDTVTFWVEAEVFTSGTNEKAVLDGWTGATNGTTTMNVAVTATANWHDEYLVTVDNSGHGTASADTWVKGGESYSLSIDDIVTEGDTRYVFAGWVSTDSGGYNGVSPTYMIAAVNNAITEKATWTTQHRLSIVSTSGDETGIGDPRTIPPAQEWVDEGTVVTIEVDKTVEIGDTRYKFKNWVGAVADPNSPTTTVTVGSPTALTVEWDSEPTFSIMDYWWLFVVIIIIVVALVAVLLMRKKKPAEEEIPPPEEEEFAEEEAPPIEE